MSNDKMAYKATIMISKGNLDKNRQQDSLVLGMPDHVTLETTSGRHLFVACGTDKRSCAGHGFCWNGGRIFGVEGRAKSRGVSW